MTNNEQQPLTKKQKRTLDFIKDFINKYGYPPSFREIGKGIGVSSTATVFSQIKYLREKGYLENNKRESRTIKLASRSKPKDDKLIEWLENKIEEHEKELDRLEKTIDYDIVACVEERVEVFKEVLDKIKEVNYERENKSS